MISPTQVVTKLRNLFNPAPVEFDYDNEMEADTIYVDTTADLPLDGVEGIKYHVLADLSDWRFNDGVYREINPYVFGVDVQYRDEQRVIRPKQTLTDYTAELASLSLDQVRDGGSPTLAVIYNVIALRADLDRIRRLDIANYKVSLQDHLSKGRHVDKAKNVSEWFRNEHKALHVLLMSSARGKDKMYAPVQDALHVHKADLRWDDELNGPVFKIDDLKVIL